MTVAEEHTKVPARVRRGVALAAVLTFANLLALHIVLLAVQAYYLEPSDTDPEIWYPIMSAVLAQAVLNGLILVAWKPSRRAGVGILLGALAVAAVACVLLIIAIATMSYP